ncbi:hypothetical protein BC739_004048 [Kutzneria viridogrisea]|uniref:Uncharacterized protein n=1 Tax=Kutzneria viridogrisea TaxID=47990 RepID=A0ABR6BJL8_9PSEU|nr:hypothetical protein [Kutzneria viridogrisea]
MSAPRMGQHEPGLAAYRKPTLRVPNSRRRAVSSPQSASSPCHQPG